MGESKGLFTIGLVGLLLSVSFVLGYDSFNDTYADTSVVDEITIDIPASCSLTNTVGSAHTATIETGVYQENIGETTFKVFCNDSEGFAVYAVGYTNDEFGNNTLKPAMVDNSNAVATGTATSGNTSNWAMKLSAVSGTYAPTIHSTEENSNTYSFTSYHTIPSEYTKVASYSSNTDVTTGSSFKSTYAAFISQTQLADSYTGKVKYTVVHPANADVPMSTISSLTYMQDFNELTPSQRAAVLNSMSYNTTYSLIDNRDNKTYQVAKLKDDNIWMAENLDLGRTTLTGGLTSANTNLDANAATVTASTFNSWIKSSGTATYTSAELIPLTTSNTSDGLDIDTTSSTPYGTLYNYCAASAGTICSASGANNNDAISDICPAGWRLPIGGFYGETSLLYDLTDYNTNAKMRAPIASGGAAFALAGIFNNSTPTIQGSYGCYWSSTRNNGSSMHYLGLHTAGVYPANNDYRYYGYAVRCVAKKPSHTLTVSYGTGISDIKVDGKTVQDGETISSEKNTYQIVATPSLGYGFSSWSTTAGQVDNTNAQVASYTLNENATISAAASYVSTEIQNIASSSCATTASYARDSRDNHVYTIQRLADGNCWMMENLDLGRTELTTDLTPSNTNLTNTVTASTFNSWRKTSGSATYTAGEFISVDDGIDFTSKTQYGTLYNYCATSAGTICSASGANNDNATSDLCPAGWRLPTGGSSGEFKALYSLTDYNTNEKMRAPITNGGAAFALPGDFNNSTPTGQNASGCYWSSTKSGTSYTSGLYLTTVTVSPNGSLYRNSGHSIRCIIKTE